MACAARPAGAGPAPLRGGRGLVSRLRLVHGLVWASLVFPDNLFQKRNAFLIFSLSSPYASCHLHTKHARE